ncbi:tRNA-queuosine alpha-mannosyltransferase domain-containing protein [Oceanicoccus sagamiensis]|uniref:tRNA-queuosine alpha-mannosyltransferase n=1 Tax=Oceanicoccus sagamiensis TaxID=716816 RepID=A0A1X9NKU0_9GAMM|nr:DUF3524 domain-containing protein [Oceanicoccus sagamiensis]ARN75457.1 glycosyl transferase family 1 [Oceanicoccus sagamiensis]
MKILLLSAYDAASHRHWCEVLEQHFDQDQWTVLRLPARYFSWRVRGNSLSWAFSERDILSQEYDLLIATSMVDLSSLRGFVPSLASIPTLVYFHENQFAYPASQQQHSSIEPQILNLYTALAADRVVFNSDYNRQTFLSGVGALLKKMPDQVPPGLMERLAPISDILPVPLRFPELKAARDIKAPLQVLWNHRWEYDKAPERLFAAIKRVLGAGVKIELHIVGQQFRQLPPVFAEMEAYLRESYPGALKHWGFIEDSAAYQQLLSSCDIALSTALHDFQGMAVLEAVAAGCIPLLPNRLCYSEWFADTYLYPGLEDVEQEADALASQLSELARLKEIAQLPSAPSVERFSIACLGQQYSQAFAETIHSHANL